MYATCVDLENITLSDISQTQKGSIVWFHLHDIPKTGKFIGTESRTGCQGVGKGELVFNGYRVYVYVRDEDKFWV